MVAQFAQKLGNYVTNRETQNLVLQLLERTDRLSSQLSIPAPDRQNILDHERGFLTEIDRADDLRKKGHLEAAKYLLTNLKNQGKEEKVSNSLRARSETIIGVCENDLGNNESAISHFEAAYLLDATNYKIVANAAYAKLLQEDYEEAARLSKQALGLDSAAADTAAPAIYFIAIGHIEPYSDLNNIIETKYEKNANYLRAVGVAFLRKHDYQEAESRLRAALTIEPDDANSLMFLSQVLYQSKFVETTKQIFFSEYDKTYLLNSPEIIDLANRAVQNTPKLNRRQLNDALAGRSGLLAASGRTADALLDCDRVLADDPAHPVALLNRALIALAAKGYDLAIKNLTAIDVSEYESMQVYLLYCPTRSGTNWQTINLHFRLAL